MKKLIIKISDIAVYGVYVILLAALAVVAPMAAGCRPMIVLSESMEPTFEKGSMIYYRDTPFEDIEEGDVITFRTGEEGSFVTHRVVEKGELSGSLVTKGDANPTEDQEPVREEDVAGVVLEYHLPYAGTVMDRLRQIPVIAGLMGVILLNSFLNRIFAGESGNSGKNKSKKGTI